MLHFSDVFDSVANPVLGGCEVQGGKGRGAVGEPGCCCVMHLLSDVLWAERGAGLLPEIWESCKEGLL